MATGTLTGSTIASTYKSILKVKGGANTILDGDIQLIEDGDGVDSVLGLATDSALISGNGNKLYFYDADGDEHISADNAGVLSIAAGAEIDLTATAIDINGAVDMSSTLQVDGAITSSTGATITTADNTDTISLVSTDADENSGPNLRFYRNSGSPADNDYIGEIQFEGRNDNSQDVMYAGMAGKILDASDGTEDGRFELYTMTAGAQNSRVLASNTETVINQDAIDFDFRVEGVGAANALFVQGSDGKVGIGSASPGNALHVEFSDDGEFAALIHNTDADNGQGLIIRAGADSGESILSLRDQASNIKVTFLADGNVGIGEAAPSGLLHIKNAEASVTSYSSAGTVKIEDAANAGIEFVVADDKDGFIGTTSPSGVMRNYVRIGANSSDDIALITDGGVALTVDSAGDVTFTGDLIMADTKGISFAATADAATAGASMASETLDDYEEGTWDVNITDGTNAMTMDATYDTGVYTKVGNLVTVSGFFMTSSLGDPAASGNIRITGLPFPIANTFAARCGAAVGYSEGLDITAGESVSYWGEKNTTYLNLMICSSATGTNYMTAAEWTADGRIMISFSYIAG